MMIPSGKDMASGLTFLAAIVFVIGGAVFVGLWELGKFLVHHLHIGWN